MLITAPPNSANDDSCEHYGLYRRPIPLGVLGLRADRNIVTFAIIARYEWSNGLAIEARRLDEVYSARPRLTVELFQMVSKSKYRGTTRTVSISNFRSFDSQYRLTT